MTRQRITSKDLDALVARLNRVTGNPAQPYAKVGECYVSQAGNYHLSGAYGGWALHQMAGETGGTRDVLNTGHVPARELYNRMAAFVAGYEAAAAERPEYAEGEV